MTIRGRACLSLLFSLVLCAVAQSAEIQGRSPVVTPAQAASASAVRVPQLPPAALDALPGPALNDGVALPAALPGAAAPSGLPSSPALPAALPSALPNVAPVARLATVPGDKRPDPSVSAHGRAFETSGRDAARRGLDEKAQDLAPELQAAQSGAQDPKQVGEEIQRVLEGEAADRSGAEPVPYYHSAGAPSLLRRLPNPRELYRLARALAAERARALGVAEDRVVFGEVTASLPTGPQRVLHYSFFAMTGEGKAKPILVTFTDDHRLSPATPFSAQVRSWNDAMKVGRKLFPKLSEPYYFGRGSEITPDNALDEARRALPGLRGGVSFTLRMEETESTGEVDLWYRFYDDRGSEVLVNARTGGAMVLRDASPRRAPAAAAPRAAELLKSAAAGGALLPVISAVARARHDEVSAFALVLLGSFVLGGILQLLPWAASRRWGRRLVFGALLSPLLAAAFVGLKAAAGALGVTAAAAGAVKNTAKPAAPADPSLSASYGRALDAARDAALRAKLSSPAFVEARRGEHGWSFDFEADGRLIISNPAADGRMQAYAYAGRESGPLGVPLQLSAAVFAMGSKVDADSAVRLGAARLGLPAAETSLSLLALEQPRSGDKDLWYVVDDADGRRVGVNARTGAVEDLASGPARAAVEAAARGAASYKGMPWSHTEYSVSLYGYENGLRKAGATQAQLALFRALTDAAPLRGGRFNPWSGD